jgi:hypothetical protein
VSYRELVNKSVERRLKMSNLVNRAKELLDSKSVGVVIGYESGPTGVVRPAFITDPAR